MSKKHVQSEYIPYILESNEYVTPYKNKFYNLKLRKALIKFLTITKSIPNKTEQFSTRQIAVLTDTWIHQ